MGVPWLKEQLVKRIDVMAQANRLAAERAGAKAADESVAAVITSDSAKGQPESPRGPGSRRSACATAARGRSRPELRARHW